MPRPPRLRRMLPPSALPTERHDGVVTLPQSLSLRIFFALGFLCPPVNSSAETVALWMFDEPVGSARGAVLRDSSGNGYHLELGEGKIVADGKFGLGLAYPESVAEFAARRLGVQGTPLNLGKVVPEPSHLGRFGMFPSRAIGLSSRRPPLRRIPP